MISKCSTLLGLLLHVFCGLGQQLTTSARASGGAAADRVVLTTPLGKIVLRLRSDVAPGSAAMFTKLVQEGLYNGCIFYRAEDFCIQGGLRTSNGEVRPNPFGHFPFEYGLPNKRGTVTLARWEDTNSATGEFFINLKDSPHLDRTGTSGWSLGFAVFGEIESGMEVVEKIDALPVQAQGGMSMLAAPVSFQAEVASALPLTGSIAQAVQAFAIPNRLDMNVAGVGTVPIRLDSTNAPRTVAIISKLAQRGVGGRLHRVEDVPIPPSQGPPYALIQSSLDDVDGSLHRLPHEGSLAIERGSVCLIAGTSDFFISLSTHPGWEGSMTVFGHVDSPVFEDFVMPIVQRPHHSFQHPQFGTIMSMLDAPLLIRLSAANSVNLGVTSLLAVDSGHSKVEAERGDDKSTNIRSMHKYLRGEGL